MAPSADSLRYARTATARRARARAWKDRALRAAFLLSLAVFALTLLAMHAP